MKEYIIKDKKFFLITILLKSCNQIMFVFLAILLQQFIDAAIEQDIALFWRIIKITIFFFGGMSFTTYLEGLFQAKYIKSTISAVRLDCFKGIFKKKYQDFSNENSGEYLSTLSNDINLIEQNYIISFIEIISEVVKLIGTILVLMAINVTVTVLLILAGTIMVVIPIFFTKKLKYWNNRTSEQFSAFTNQAKDFFSGFEVIYTYGIEEKITNLFSIQNNELETVRFNEAKFSSLVNGVSTYFFIICQLSGTAIGAYFVLRGDLTMGSLIAIMQLANGVFTPIQSLTTHFTSLRGMEDINNKIIDIINSPPREEGNKELVTFKDKVKLKNVSFSYNNKKKVLNDVSFDFEKNKKYAIVGESGCGKSTLAKILGGFYDNFEGEVIIDDLPINDIKTSCLRESFSFVPQNSYLFDKSLQENISLLSDYPADRLSFSLEASSVTKFIKKLDGQMKMKVGENGGKLSGGQKQRVALARAFIRDAPILILDESTSSLDIQTTVEVENTLCKMEELTVIAITHKLNSDILRNYDGILYLCEGKIAEHGSFEDLMGKKGLFYNFFKSEQTHLLKNS